MFIVRLLVLLLLAVGGYWAYYVYAANSPYDQIGTAINSRLPEPARAYGCTELKKRHADAATAPAGCEGHWTAI
ncbi:hypothetical protein [Aquabacter spiritensis]|uniref:Uncharacterized protein n=1 Tax=Aquabacter spiritensis TaxID=933073 RepID=A0A4R3M5G7_9HYPH|nr:hypothetical protein [Aquabacter spiritensis]TCT07833.1 hypothetical protein EDC64_101352 [Aquabacter spiritensis]